MSAFDQSIPAGAWRFLIAKHPTAFEWDGDQYTGILWDVNSTLGLGLGGFTQGEDTRLLCLLEAFTSGTPAEGDILVAKGIPLRVSTIEQVMDFGIIFTLKGPDQP